MESVAVSFSRARVVGCIYGVADNKHVDNGVFQRLRNVVRKGLNDV